MSEGSHAERLGMTRKTSFGNFLLQVNQPKLMQEEGFTPFPRPLLPCLVIEAEKARTPGSHTHSPCVAR